MKNPLFERNFKSESKRNPRGDNIFSMKMSINRPKMYNRLDADNIYNQFPFHETVRE